MTQHQKNEIKRLSRQYYPQEIAQMLGVKPQIIFKVQNDPRNGIVNPKRKYRPRNQHIRTVAEGMFDVDGFLKMYAY